MAALALRDDSQVCNPIREKRRAQLRLVPCPVLQVNNGITTYSNQTDANGLIISKFDLHNPQTLVNDSRGRVVSRTFQSGKILTYGYDDFDRVTSITDNNGPSATFVYDVMGKMKSKTVTPQGGGTPQVTQYQYDDRDRLIAKTDPTGRATFHDYSIVSVGCHVRDLPTKVTEPGNKVTAMEYDNRQRLIRKTDADNHVTRYEYNPRGDRTDVYSSVPEGTRKWKNKANEAEAKTPGDIASGV